jgi:hypothetical protein
MNVFIFHYIPRFNPDFIMGYGFSGAFLGRFSSGKIKNICKLGILM